MSDGMLQAPGLDLGVGGTYPGTAQVWTDDGATLNFKDGHVSAKTLEELLNYVPSGLVIGDIGDLDTDFATQYYNAARLTALLNDAATTVEIHLSGDVGGNATLHDHVMDSLSHIADQNFTTTRKWLMSQGDGVESGIPEFDVITAADIASGELAIDRGGTGESTAEAAFDALAPPTTQGDLIVRGASSNERLAKGFAGQILTMVDADTVGWADLSSDSFPLSGTSWNTFAVGTGGGLEEDPAFQWKDVDHYMMWHNEATMFRLSHGLEVGGNLLMHSGDKIYLGGFSSGDTIDPAWWIGKDASHNIDVVGYGDSARAFRICDQSTSTVRASINFATGALSAGTINALTLAAQTVGFTIAGGATSKTLTVPLDASVSGTNTGDQVPVHQLAGDGDTISETATVVQIGDSASTVHTPSLVAGRRFIVYARETASGCAIVDGNFKIVSDLGTDYTQLDVGPNGAGELFADEDGNWILINYYAISGANP